jgi:hypothetical protein
MRAQAFKLTASANANRLDNEIVGKRMLLQTAELQVLRTKLSSASYWILLSIAFLHVFLMEDTYGLDNASPSLVYQSFGGITILDMVIVALSLAFLAGKAKVVLARRTRRLFLLLGITLVIAYATALAEGNLFGGGLGSGLKELRAAVIMCFLYFVFRRTLFDCNRLLSFTRILGWIILFSAVVHLVQYLFGWGNFISPEYGELTAFEGPLLVWWVFGFSLFLARSVVKAGGLLDTGMALTIAIAIFLSFRRMPEFMSVVILAVILAYGLRKLRKSLLAITLLGAVGILMVVVWGNKFLPKINLVNLFDTNSAEYARNFSSNRQHVDDIILGWELIKQHYMLGIGPGAVFQSPDPDKEFAMNTMVHMQYWGFWLRLGFLGLSLLFYFYYIQCKYVLMVLKRAANPRATALALSILAFTLASAGIASLVGISIYGTTKLQYLTMYVLAAAEIVYLDNKISNPCRKKAGRLLINASEVTPPNQAT